MVFPQSLDADRATAGRSPDRPAVVVYAFLDFGAGGAQRLTLATCRFLRRDLFSPRIVCVRGAGALVPAARADGLEVAELGRLRSPWDLSAPRRIARFLAELETEILHVPLYSRASPYLRLAARLARVPLVVAHDWSDPEPHRFARRVADRLLRPRTRFVAASRAQLASLLASGVDPSSAAVVHAGVECERFESGDRAGCRAALGLGEREVAALVPARLHRAKGHADLLDALPEIRRRAPELRFLFAGDGPERAALEARVDAMGQREAVRFLGWRDDVRDLLAAADLVVLPSRIEGLPAAMLEAFSAGRPVVATDVGGVGEALADGIEGRLVPYRDPGALADAVTALALDPAGRAEMGERGRRRAARDFHVRRATERLEELYLRWGGELERRASAA